MSTRLNFSIVPEENKSDFVPKKECLTIFESWAMEMMYASLVHETRGDVNYSIRDVTITNVWNGNELYNTEWQILPEERRQSRLWLTDKNVLMLELISDDLNTPNDLYYFH